MAGVFSLGPEYKFDRDIINIFNSIKNEEYRKYKYFYINVFRDGKVIAVLRPLTKNSLQDNDKNREIIRLLTKWRDASNVWFPAIFKVTEESTQKWLKEKVIEQPDRLLFMVETPYGMPFGHMGLYRGEADNFIRGRDDLVKGGMTRALEAMLKWASDDLRLEMLHLKVFADNRRAMGLYNRCGFREIGRIPMKKVENNDSIIWEETLDNSGQAERYLCVMENRLAQNIG